MRLRELRLEKGWSQERASEICCLGQKMFQLYELGVKNNPSLQTLEKIAHGFGMDISELLASVFPKKKQPKSSAKKSKSRRAK
jgi:transcriptional regulator with XRE-family HTH domain